jgi:DNA repair protein REV1
MAQNSINVVLRGRGLSEVPNQTSMHHDGSFARYMQLKNQKLHEQFHEDQMRLERCERSRSTIFEGITIHVNGLTNPTHQVLDPKRI